MNQKLISADDTAGGMPCFRLELWSGAGTNKLLPIMKRSMLPAATVLLLALVSTGRAEAPRATEVIILAGQSNAVGFDARAEDLPADSVDEKVLLWWRCGDPPPDEHDSTSGGKWTHLRAQPRGEPQAKDLTARQYGNFASPEGGFGPEIGLARTLHTKERKPLAIVKTAFSGTAMARDWNPADAGPGGSCYRALVAETKAAMSAAKAQGLGPHLRALVWVQGESDANEQAAPRYAEALGRMIGALRKDLDAPQLTVLLGVNTQFSNGKNPFVPKIVEAQQALASQDPHCAYVDTAGATIANQFHFDSPGMLDVGARYAAALLQLESRSPATIETKR